MGKNYDLENTAPNKCIGAAQAFLSQKQVKEYNSLLYTAMANNHSLSLGPLDEVNKSIEEYFDLCKKTDQLPSIKALALYLGVTYKTLLGYMDDVTSPYYNMLGLARDLIHVIIENGAMNNKVNPATYMFTAANYYGMKNTQSVEIGRVQTSAEKDLARAQESIDALKNIINRPDVKKVVDMEESEGVILGIEKD